MIWLSRFIRRLRWGIRPRPRVAAEPCWKLPHVLRDLPSFVRALPKLLPEGGVFYGEGPAATAGPAAA
ncbi:MAG: hypothetical protein GXP25_19720 [Planctomycetes bacterium]|nr:hypothetical protein [Planctomycetota bacterium]